jgi:transposase
MNFKSSHAQNQRIEKITKEEAVRLSDEIGPKKAAEQLGVSYYTL